MAFGFVRQPGSAKRYLNPLIGVTISRRQYAALTERERAAAIATLRRSADDLESGVADTVADALSGARATQRAAFDEAMEAQRAAALAQREAEALRAAGFRPRLSGAGRERASRLQNQYNALLETFVRSERAKGRPISKRAARSDDRFKRAVKMIRTRRRFGETNFQRAVRLEAVRQGFQAIGTEDQFRQVYEQLRAMAEDMDGEE